MGNKSSNRSFGIADYSNMAKSRGLRLPLSYFFENHLFDIIYKTDTHKWLPIENYDTKITNLAHGVLYMASWTSVVVKSTKIALVILKNENNNFDLVDVGSGKGKTLLVWAKLMKLSQNKIYGIEYSEDLLAICKNNIRHMKKSDISLINADASEIDGCLFKKKLLLYLYNPFDSLILKKFLSRLNDKNIVLIYNNPVHSYVLDEMGYEKVYTKDSWHSSGRFIIYKSRGSF